MSLIPLFIGEKQQRREKHQRRRNHKMCKHKKYKNIKENSSNNQMKSLRRLHLKNISLPTKYDQWIVVDENATSIGSSKKHSLERAMDEGVSILDQ